MNTTTPPLSKVWFAAEDWMAKDALRVVDSHGQDITSRLCVTEIGFNLKVEAHGLAMLEMILTPEWTLDLSSGLTNHLKLVHKDGYELFEALEVIGVQIVTPLDKRIRLRLEFYATWEGK